MSWGIGHGVGAVVKACQPWKTLSSNPLVFEVSDQGSLWLHAGASGVYHYGRALTKEQICKLLGELTHPFSYIRYHSIDEYCILETSLKCLKTTETTFFVQ